MSKAGTTTVKPTIKISSVKIPNAAQAAKPIVTKKAALRFPRSNSNVKGSTFSPPKTIQ